MSTVGVFSTMGVIMSTVGMFSTMGVIMSTVGLGSGEIRVAFFQQAIS